MGKHTQLPNLHLPSPHHQIDPVSPPTRHALSTPLSLPITSHQHISPVPMLSSPQPVSAYSTRIPKFVFILHNLMLYKLLIA